MAGAADPRRRAPVELDRGVRRRPRAIRAGARAPPAGADRRGRGGLACRRRVAPRSRGHDRIAHPVRRGVRQLRGARRRRGRRALRGARPPRGRHGDRPGRARRRARAARPSVGRGRRGGAARRDPLVPSRRGRAAAARRDPPRVLGPERVPAVPFRRSRGDHRRHGPARPRARAGRSARRPRCARDDRAATRQLRVALAEEDGDSVVALVRRCETALESLGVVPPQVASAIRAIERDGGGAKVSGAGGRTGAGAGLVLVVHPDPGWHARFAPPRGWTQLPAALGAPGLLREAA